MGTDDTEQTGQTADAPYEEGERAGAHPFAVIVGIILGLWLLMWLYIPSSKNRPSPVPDNSQISVADEPDAAPVIFKVKGAIPEVNAISVLVPSQATNSQIIGLLKRFHHARLAHTLSTLLPPTTPGHKLGDHAVADIYVFSSAEYANLEAVRVLARGAHAPGELYPQAIPFETVMEHVRGHYRIDLNDTGEPDKASLGFADESGVHSKQYRRIF
jgi:hypothetical protein